MQTLASPSSFVREVKKSRFTARASPVSSADEALSFVESTRDPQATHNCWAFRVDQIYRFSDDGEPAGTAGRPILAAIDGQKLDHVVVVVARRFGGIKLGAGGLARAYGGTAAECLRLAKRREIRTRIRAKLVAPFDIAGAVWALIDSTRATRVSESHTGEGTVWVLEMDEDAWPLFRDAAAGATRGRARIERIEE